MTYAIVDDRGWTIEDGLTVEKRRSPALHITSGAGGLWLFELDSTMEVSCI